jgi:hypothetical protein
MAILHNQIRVRIGYNYEKLSNNRPSIWKCLDCGYEGAFIIEDGELAEKMPERYQKRCNIIDWAEEERRMDNWDGSTDNWPKILENHM